MSGLLVLTQACIAATVSTGRRVTFLLNSHQLLRNADSVCGGVLKCLGSLTTHSAQRKSGMRCSWLL